MSYTSAGVRAAVLGLVGIVATIALIAPENRAAAHYVDISDEVAVPGQLTMGLALTGRPFAYLDEHGEPAGLDVDLARAITEAAGHRLGIEVVPRRRLPGALEAGEVDFVNTSALDAADRDALLGLSYLAVGDHVLLHRSNPFRVRSVEDLSGRVASALSGSSAEDYARRLDENFRQAGLAEMEVHSFPFTRYAAFPVRMGHAAAWFVDTRTAVGTLQDPESRMRLLEDAFRPVDEVGIGLAPSRTRTHHVLEHGLAGLVTSERYDRILGTHGVPTTLSLFR